MNGLLRSIMKKFMEDSSIEDKDLKKVKMYEGNDLMDVDINDLKNFRPIQELDIGIAAKRTISKFKESERQNLRLEFRKCLIVLAENLKKDLPITNSFLRDLEVLHPLMRKESSDNAIMRLCVKMKPLKFTDQEIDNIVREWQIYRIDEDIDEFCEGFIKIVDTEKNVVKHGSNVLNVPITLNLLNYVTKSQEEKEREAAAAKEKAKKKRAQSESAKVKKKLKTDTEEKLKNLYNHIKSLKDELKFKRNTTAKIGKILYQQKILDEQQQIILLNQEKILGLLLQKESSLPQLEDMRKMFPLKTVQDLGDLSSLIAEEGNMKQLVRICKSIGGIDVKQSVKFLMRRLLTDHLCAAFSFQGRRKNPAFDHFLINEAIRSSIKERFPEATDAIVDKYVQDHLRYAPQREKRINGNEDDSQRSNQLKRKS
ncbi:hypothetical protein JTE90_012426 [Oedothorax gibbosus]|uniref:DUF4806 domain-containing protein n=1 Tax=Oedothorax gibbosus TaxID=931172 RepID=A0AAV6TNT9_9ARAC|nr:hypothetical protein JTE90_012426 [Oedothorax gibbosus]